jgi:signal transduction histidine kinase
MTPEQCFAEISDTLHDIRNQLTAITGNASLLAISKNLEPEELESAELINQMALEIAQRLLHVESLLRQRS